MLPGSWCLRATFTKDLSSKYGRYVRRTRPFARRTWCAAGTYDFLEFETVHSLAELSNLRSGGADGACGDFKPWEDTRRLVMFPFKGPDESTDSQNFAPPREVVEAISNPSPAKHPLLVLTKISLSPTAFECQDGEDALGPRVGSVFRILMKLISLMKSGLPDNPDLPPVGFFGSLSGPDLVMIAAPKKPRQLYAVHSLARVVRTLRLAELDQQCFAQPAEDGSSPEERRPGHACVMVSPVLAFQLEAGEEVFNTEVFRNEEDAFGIRLPFELRVDCGHEATVISDMRDVCRGDVHFDPPENPKGKLPWGRIGTDLTGEKKHDRPVTAWHTHLVRGHFTHLAGFAKAWKVLWFNDLERNDG